MPKRKLLITGAAGRIGSSFARHAHQRYDLRLMTQPADSPERINTIKPFGEIVTGDIRDLARMKELSQNIHTVLHLAADPNASSTWDVNLNTNIIGTYNTFAAARHAGCARVVFASSIHAVSGYGKSVQVKEHDPVNPGDLYGVSKCFGESLARYMAEQEKLPSICIRIGAWLPADQMTEDFAAAHLDTFISARDLNQLIEKSIEADHLSFAILHGTSAGMFRRLDITQTMQQVGYHPQDDASQFIPPLKALDLASRLLAHNLVDGRQESGLRDDVT